MLNIIFNLISRWIGILAFIVVATAIIGMQLISHFGDSLPDYKKLSEYDPPTITRIYSISGDVIAEYSKERRIYVEYDNIPQIVIDAFLAAEDKNFFNHGGIDIYSTLRAALQTAFNIISNKRAVGGSTITQQVVKSFLLGDERSLDRKIKEAILSFRISKVYSKNKILELYLNQIFLGNNSYGIVVAAENYFNKKLSDLTVPEAAMLAALPKAPSNLNPLLHYNKAIARRNWVIDRMAEDGFITMKEAEFFVKTPIALVRPQNNQISAENSYIDAVTKELIHLFGEEALYTRGMIVNTYFEKNIHHQAELAFVQGIKKYDKRKGWRGPIAKLETLENWEDRLPTIKKSIESNNIKPAVVLEVHPNSLSIGLKNNELGVITEDNVNWIKKSSKSSNLKSFFRVGDIVLTTFLHDDRYALDQIPEVEGAMIVMEPNTGRVFSIIGGYNKESYFNRALQAQRQSGSTFKPFVYLTALNNGYELNSILLDDHISISQGPNLPKWEPKNFEGKFSGPMTLRRAFEKSRNIPTIRIIMDLGVNKIIDTATIFKLYSNKIHSNYAVALGAAETKLIDITNAFNAIASNGLETIPKFIDSVYDRKGNLLYKNQDLRCHDCNLESTPFIKHLTHRLIAEDINYQLTSLLVGAMKRGTGAKSNILNKTIAGKTGTTNNCFDTWFIGFTPYMTAGLYIGHDTPRSMGDKESGATIALPIFIDFAKYTIGDKKDIKFTVPDSIVFKRINSLDGNIIKDKEPGDSDTILEAFRKENRFSLSSNIINNQENRDHFYDIMSDLITSED